VTIQCWNLLFLIADWSLLLFSAVASDNSNAFTTAQLTYKILGLMAADGMKLSN